MQLITKEIRRAAPALYANQDKKPEDVPIVAKFFTPWTSWTWYMTEYDPATERAFGFVTSDMCPQGELGYFSITELRSITGPFGLTIERDLYYSPHTLAQVMEEARAR